MADDFETVELEYSEEDILYHILDEDGTEVGIAVMEDGEEVEYYYEGFDAEDFEIIDEDTSPEPPSSTPAGTTEEVVEMEIDEDRILYYLVDEDDNEIGFVIEENGQEVECYYEEDTDDDDSHTSGSGGNGSASANKSSAKADSSESEEHGYLYKIASIAGHHGNKARKKAEVEIDKVRGVAEKQVAKATVAVESKGKQIKAKQDESGFGITREDVTKTTADLNVIAKEGAETVKELKGAYDDIMDSFGFLVPKKVRRKLP